MFNIILFYFCALIIQSNIILYRSLPAVKILIEGISEYYYFHGSDNFINFISVNQTKYGLACKVI